MLFSADSVFSVVNPSPDAAESRPFARRQLNGLV